MSLGVKCRVRLVNTQETRRCQMSDAFDLAWAAINGQREAAALHNTSLAHNQKLLRGQIVIVNGQNTIACFALQPARQLGQKTIETILPKGLNQVWETLCFQQNNAVQSNRVMVEHQLNGRLSHFKQSGADIQRAVLKQLFESAKFFAAHFLKKSDEQIRFVLKMVIQRSFRDACFPGNMRHGRSFVAVFKKHNTSTMEKFQALGLCLRIGRAIRIFVRECLLRLILHDTCAGLSVLTERFGQYAYRILPRVSTPSTVGVVL